MNTLATLWQGASYQDHLLQAYRKLHVFLQSVILAIGAGLTIAILFNNSLNKLGLLYLLLMAFTAFGIYLLVTMSKLIKARAADVDYYHNRIIESERGLSKEEQVLTAFKVYQKWARDERNPQEFFHQFKLTEELRCQLTEKGKGHTRKLIDRNLSWGFLLLWLTLHGIVAFNWLIN